MGRLWREACGALMAAAEYIGPQAAPGPIPELAMHAGRWRAFEVVRPSIVRRTQPTPWRGAVQQLGADELYFCPHGHSRIWMARDCARREARRRARADFEEECEGWRRRLGLDIPVQAPPLAITTTLEEARLQGFWVFSRSHLHPPSQWDWDCYRRNDVRVEVRLVGARRTEVTADLLTALPEGLEGVDASARLLKALREGGRERMDWLLWHFTANGGWYSAGDWPKSDRVPRERAAELAVRLLRLGRELAGTAHEASG